MSDDKLCPRSGEPLPQRRHDDQRAGMAAVEIHISGTAERLGLVEMQADRLAELEELFKKYIRHVGCCEGVNFTRDSDRHRHRDFEKFTDEQWDELRNLAKLAYTTEEADPAQTELGL